MPASAEERITFICSACNARLKVPARHAGVTGPCPKCNATITAPKPKAAVEVAPPTAPQRETASSEATAEPPNQAQQAPTRIVSQPQPPAASSSPASVVPPAAESPVAPAPNGDASAPPVAAAPTPAAAPDPASTAPQFPIQREPIDLNADTIPISPPSQSREESAPPAAPATTPSPPAPSSPDPAQAQPLPQQPSFSAPQTTAGVPQPEQSPQPDPTAAPQAPTSFDSGSPGAPAGQENGLPAVVPPWLSMSSASGAPATAADAPTQQPSAPATHQPGVAPSAAAGEAGQDPFSNPAPQAQATPAAVEPPSAEPPSPAAPAPAPENPGFSSPAPTAEAPTPVSQEPRQAPAVPPAAPQHSQPAAAAPTSFGDPTAGDQGSSAAEVRLAPPSEPLAPHLAPATGGAAAPTSPPLSAAQFNTPPATEAPQAPLPAAVLHAAAPASEPAAETVDADIVEPSSPPSAPENPTEAPAPTEPLPGGIPSFGSPPSTAAAPVAESYFSQPPTENPLVAGAQPLPATNTPPSGEMGGNPPVNPFQPPVAEGAQGNDFAPPSQAPEPQPEPSTSEAQPQAPQQNAFQPPSPANEAGAQPEGVANPRSTPSNLPPFDASGNPINRSKTSHAPPSTAAPNEARSPFATPGTDPASGELPQSRSFDPSAAAPSHGGEPFGSSAAPHSNPVQGPVGVGVGAGVANGSAAQAAGLADVPENPQNHPDLDSFVQAAAQSEKNAREKRKPGRYGSMARILTIIIGLCVALVSLLFIDHKQDGIAVLHKIPGFGALSDKFGNILASKSDGAPDPNGGSDGAGTGTGLGTTTPANNGNPTTPPSTQPGTPPTSDAQLTKEDATDNGETTIPLNPDALNADTLNSDASTRALAPGGEVSTTDPAPAPALATGGSPSVTTAENPGPAAGTGPVANPQRTEITPGPGPGNANPTGAAPESAPTPGGGDIVLTPPGQVGNGGTIGAATADGSVGAPPAATPGAAPPTGGASAAPLKATALPDNTAVPPAAETGIGPLKANLPGDGELAEPRRAVTNYLDAPNWQARLPLIYKGDKLQSKISGYYDSNTDTAISPYDLEFFHMEESAGPGKPYYIYFVTTPKVPQGFPAIVRRTTEGFKLDWECFVEFHDSHFVKFHDNKEPGPKSFRVVLKRAEYWGDDRTQFADLDNYLCYRIELPYAELDYYAFVPRDQPLADELQGMVDWGKPPLAGIITFKRENFAHGVSHLMISDFVTEDWFRPVD